MNIVQKFLCLSNDQIKDLEKLSASKNNGSEGIDKEILSIARSIVEQKPISCDRDLWDQVSEILQGAPPKMTQNNNNFGL